MLIWTAIFAAVACLAGLAGYTSLAEGVAGLARITGFLFLVGFTLSLAVRRLRRRRLAASPTQRRLSGASLTA